MEQGAKIVITKKIRIILILFIIFVPLNMAGGYIFDKYPSFLILLLAIFSGISALEYHKLKGNIRLIKEETAKERRNSKIYFVSSILLSLSFIMLIINYFNNA